MTIQEVVELPPHTEHNEVVPIDQPIEHYISAHYDKILAAEVAWQQLGHFLNHSSSEEQLHTYAGMVDERLADPNAPLGKYNPHKILSAARKGVSATFTQAKWNAQILVWGNEEQQAVVQKYLEDLEDTVVNADSRYHRHFFTMQIEATELFQAAYQSDATLLQPLQQLLAEDPALLEDLCIFLESDEIDISDYSGLLTALARTHFDPLEESPITTCIANLQERREQVATKLLQTESSETASSDSQKVMQLLTQFAIYTEINPQVVQDFITTIPFGALPESVQNEVTRQHQQAVNTLHTRCKNLLQPYDRPKRYLLKAAPRYAATPASKKSKSAAVAHTGSRAMPKLSGNLDMSLEETGRQTVASVYQAKRIANHYEVTDVIAEKNEAVSYGDWLEQAVENIMDTKEFRTYVARYHNPNDLIEMLYSIVQDPIGNGVSPMNGQFIRLITPDQPSHSKKRPVLHFSPPDSQGIGFRESPESIRTRIFYCLHKGTLVLLDIQHKTTAEKQSGVLSR